MVAARGLTKVFRDFWMRPRARAVDHLSFEIQPNEIFGLLGPNGSGKSTTIKMILGLLHPTRGALRVLGKAPRDVKAKARVGYLPEESYLYPYLTSEETLNFYARLFDLDRAERRERIEQLLDMIGLKHARHRVVGEFSKGMARRIGLAQALVNDPDLVILDEPTSGLDPLGTRQVKDLILNLARRGKTVLLSSHLLSDVEDVCDRILILYNGRVQAAGSIHELLEEKERYRLTLPEVSPEALQDILAEVRERLGAEPDVDHPRLNLEQFFLDVVARARSATEGPASGVAHGEQVAGYLSAEKRLAGLVEPPASPETPPPPEAPVADTEERRKAADQKLEDLLPPKP